MDSYYSSLEHLKVLYDKYEKEKIARQVAENENARLISILKLHNIKFEEGLPIDFLRQLNNPETSKNQTLKIIDALQHHIQQYGRDPEVIRCIFTRMIDLEDTEIALKMGHLFVLISPDQEFTKRIVSILHSEITNEERIKTIQILEDIVIGLCEGDAEYVDRRLKHRIALLFAQRMPNPDTIELALRKWLLNKSQLSSSINDDFLSRTIQPKKKPPLDKSKAQELEDKKTIYFSQNKDKSNLDSTIKRNASYTKDGTISSSSDQERSVTPKTMESEQKKTKEGLVLPSLTKHKSNPLILSPLKTTEEDKKSTHNTKDKILSFLSLERDKPQLNISSPKSVDIDDKKIPSPHPKEKTITFLLDNNDKPSNLSSRRSLELDDKKQNHLESILRNKDNENLDKEKTNGHDKTSVAQSTVFQERKNNLVNSFQLKLLRGNNNKRSSIHHEQNNQIRNQLQKATSNITITSNTIPAPAAASCVALVEKLTAERKSDIVPWLLNLLRYLIQISVRVY